MDYNPSVQHVDGKYTDMLVEEMLNLIYQNYYSADHFDEVFTGIVQTYINPDCPTLIASRAGSERLVGVAIHYFTMLGLSYTVIHQNNPEWPGFDFMPDAAIAVSVTYPDGVHATSYTPGRNINQAALAAIMQLAREVAIENYNQPELDMNPNHA